MAMTKCHECKKDISTTAAACPHCGAKPKPKTSGCAWLALIFIAIPVVFGIVMSESRKQEAAAQVAADQARAAERAKAEAARLAAMTPEQRAEAEKAAEAAAKEAAAQAEAAAEKAREQALIASGVRWRYSESADEMGRGTVRNAIARSVNAHEFKFPYAGEQRASLQVRKHPKHGTDVIFFIERGQFVCDVYTCAVTLRYDDRPPVTVAASKPADHDTTTVFFPNAGDMIRQLVRSKRLRVEANYYNNGSRVFEFDVSGLEWK